MNPMGTPLIRHSVFGTVVIRQDSLPRASAVGNNTDLATYIRLGNVHVAAVGSVKTLQMAYSQLISARRHGAAPTEYDYPVTI